MLFGVLRWATMGGLRLPPTGVPGARAELEGGWCLGLSTVVIHSTRPTVPTSPGQGLLPEYVGWEREAPVLGLTLLPSWGSLVWALLQPEGPVSETSVPLPHRSSAISLGCTGLWPPGNPCPRGGLMGQRDEWGNGVSFCQPGLLTSWLFALW